MRVPTLSKYGWSPEMAGQLTMPLMVKDKAGQQQQERGTTGQAPRGEQKDKAGQQRQECGTTGRERQQPDREMQREGQQPRQDMQRGERARQPGAAQDRGGEAGASVTLNTEQKTKIRETVLQRGAAPRISRSDIDVDIRVGTTVPRERVRLQRHSRRGGDRCYLGASPGGVSEGQLWVGRQ
jgi:hypothetical protein